MIANLAATVHVAASAPRALDPDVPTTAALPATLFPHVADTFALVVAVVPDPLAAAAVPATLHPDEAGASLDNDGAWGRRFLFHLDVGDGSSDVTLGTNDAPSGEHCERAGDGQASEGILQSHDILLRNYL
jgi:hypothetical protein